MLTPERLRELLAYDRDTGLLTWKFSRRKTKAGQVAGYRDPLGYVRISVDDQTYLAHRLAWLHVFGRWPSGMIDHKNGDPSDNSLNNLREASPSQNRMNCRRHSNNACGLKGVCYDKSKKRWDARISVGGRQRRIGRFVSAEAAHAAYVAASIKHYGQFARTE